MLCMLIGFLIVWVVCLVLMIRDTYCDLAEKIFLPVFGGLLGMLIGVVISIGITEYVPTVWKQYNITPIVAMSNRQSVSGSFFLGSGNINDVMYYYYYAKDGDGYAMRKVNVNDCIIFEGCEPEESNIETLKKGYENNIWKWFTLLNDGYYYRFYIPKGSIIQEFKLGL